jgi:hypothetical protein
MKVLDATNTSGEYADIFNTLDGRYFIQKPIENEELIARLNKIIRIY